MDVTHRTSEWSAALAGSCACLVGIGLARFGYSPLIPVLISAHWLQRDDAIYLGAANLLGYLIGVWFNGPWTGSRDPGAVLRAMMLVTACSVAAFADFLSPGFGYAALFPAIAGA